MGSIRVMSWNLRTLGTHTPSDDQFKRMIEIMFNSRADIICIQELQIGINTGRKKVISNSISQTNRDLMTTLTDLMNKQDPGGAWESGITGINSGSQNSMRDSYGFLVRTKPFASKNHNGDPVDGIIMIDEPEVLRQPKQNDHFPGRRPGMLTCGISVGTQLIPVNIISYHALTPNNTFKGAGKGIEALASLPEVGGIKLHSKRQLDDKEKNLENLPSIDTIVLGDFNYSTDISGAIQVYHNLIKNYQPCINDPANITVTTYTTYSPNASMAFRKVSAYDNIFLLKEHTNFIPSLTYNNVFGVTDFIKEVAESDITFYTDPSGAWGTAHKTLYGQQNGKKGISDHLPVWADFKIGNSGKSPTALRILPTCGLNNNCMFHAMFGEPLLVESGLYYCADANTRRENFIEACAKWDKVKAFPTDSIRRGIIGAMLNFYEGNNAASLLLQWLIDYTLASPFSIAGFTPLYQEYVNNIPDRMLYTEEMEAVAVINDITVNLYVLDRGQYVLNTTYNASADPMVPHVNVFHHGLHFNRFNVA